MYDFNRDVMIDLETVGVTPGCGILSIGACTLDESRVFYATINIESCYAAGLKSEISTLSWWNNQDPKVREEAFSGELELIDALEEFNIWLKDIKPEGVWGNGASFDNAILTVAARVFPKIVLYNTFKDRCYRTVKNLYPDIKADSFIGDKHNALADARHQAKHLHKILTHISIQQAPAQITQYLAATKSDPFSGD